jgi:hypothetical protein
MVTKTRKRSRRSAGRGAGRFTRARPTRGRGRGGKRAARPGGSIVSKATSFVRGFMSGGGRSGRRRR